MERATTIEFFRDMAVDETAEQDELEGYAHVVVDGEPDVRIRLRVDGGMAQVSVGDLPDTGLTSDDAGTPPDRGLRVESFVPDLGEAVYAVTSAQVLSMAVPVHRVGLRPVADWSLEVRSASGAPLVDREIEVRRNTRSSWATPASFAPTPAAERLDLEIENGHLSLPAPRNPLTTFWVGAPGHAWTSLRWAARVEQGHSMSLVPWAEIELVPDPQLVGSTFTLRIFDPNRMWQAHPRLEHNGTLEAVTVLSVPPGEHSVVVSCPPRAAVSGESMLWAEAVELTPMVRSTMALDLVPADLALDVTFKGSGPIAPDDLSLWFLGNGHPGTSKRPIGQPESLSSGTEDCVASWSPAQFGYYAIQLRGGVCYPIRLVREGGPRFEAAFDYVEPIVRHVYLSPRLSASDSGQLAGEPVWVRASAVDGDIETWPALAFPRLEVDGPRARFIAVEAPTGSSLSIAYKDRVGLENDRIVLTAETTYESTLTGRVAISWLGSNLRPSKGWAAGVRFAGDDGGLERAANLLDLDDSGVAVVGYVGEAVSRVYLPSSPGMNALGGWFDLPAGVDEVAIDAVINSNR